ncbi:MAG: AAA family ATPase [Hyphomonas sp.]|uniref:AAA family ATPase n=1 Tax=Hyphomonas sp. TaxID=87 RepID=UPI003001AA06
MPDKLSIELSDHESLHDLGKFSVILGKNGSGKSTILRLLDTQFSRKGDLVRYITPERGGTLEYQGQIDTNQSQDPSWLNGARRSNQFNQFRQSSVSEFRRLEILVLRAIESDAEIRESSFNFQIEIDKINTLLDQVEIRRDAKGTFEILDVRTGNIRAASELSSGESELISLAVEVLLFAYLCQMPAHKDKTNWLLMDEPDVHLHPDLQYRIVKLLAESLRTVPSARVIIATHSTSILSAMVD